MSEQADRIVELEIRLSHQERTIEQLNEVVLQLSRENDALRRRLDKLEASLEEDGTEVGPANERPPHW